MMVSAGFFHVVKMYIQVIINCKNLSNCLKFYEIERPSFWLQSSLMPLFSGTQFTLSFLHERLHSKNVCEIHLNISSGHYGVRLQVIQPFLKF